MKAEVNGLNKEVVELLCSKGMKISAAESCTGGLFAALITDVSGASDVLDESFVTYANSAKMKHLGVKKETLEKHGAVSYETAFEMASGLHIRTGADVTVGITGIAGPGGGTAKKPVGLVYAGVCINGETEVIKMNHSGNREEVREKTCGQVFETIKNKISVL